MVLVLSTGRDGVGVVDRCGQGGHVQHADPACPH